MGTKERRLLDLRLKIPLKAILSKFAKKQGIQNTAEEIDRLAIDLAESAWDEMMSNDKFRGRVVKTAMEIANERPFPWELSAMRKRGQMKLSLP